MPVSLEFHRKAVEAKRETKRDYQRRFRARTTPAPEPKAELSPMTAAERDERDEYEAAVRQHLADVAAGDIPPATNGSATLLRRRWGGS